MAKQPTAKEPSTPAKWIGSVEAIDAEAALEGAAKLLKVQDSRRLIAVRHR
jgi:hypothetical protein